MEPTPTKLYPPFLRIGCLSLLSPVLRFNLTAFHFKFIDVIIFFITLIDEKLLQFYTHLWSE